MGILELPSPPDLIWADTHFFHVAMQFHYPWRCDVIGRERPIASGEVTLADATRFAEVALQTLTGLQGATVLHVGDVAMGQALHHVMVRDAIRESGVRLVLVRGNHDGSVSRCSRLGAEVVCDAVRFTADGRQVTARHDPTDFTEKDAQRSETLLHGHCHGNPAPAGIPLLIRAKLIDGSMDRLRTLRPVTWSELLASGLTHCRST